MSNINEFRQTLLTFHFCCIFQLQNQNLTINDLGDSIPGDHTFVTLFYFNTLFVLHVYKNYLVRILFCFINFGACSIIQRFLDISYYKTILNIETYNHISSSLFATVKYYT